MTGGGGLASMSEDTQALVVRSYTLHDATLYREIEHHVADGPVRWARPNNSVCSYCIVCDLELEFRANLRGIAN